MSPDFTCIILILPKNTSPFSLTTVSPRLIQLELTESDFFDNRLVTRDIVDRLHQASFAVLMDDFGTGYSFLNLLKDLSVDVLKLDKGFMEDAANNEKEQRIVASIVQMTQSLGMKVTAEGVETDAQYRYLLSVGCDEIFRQADGKRRV